MSGLTLNTETNPPRKNKKAPNHSSATNAPRPLQSTTPIPVPIPMPYTYSREPQQTSPRSSSPTRPSYSPITPPLNPIASPPRPTYTHTSQSEATATLPPPAEPIDFDSNPDVLALKSAISILVMQRRKAERDMATLSRVRNTALSEPEAFVHDLTAGRVRVEGESIFLRCEHDEDDEEDESESDSESDDAEMSGTNQPKEEKKRPDPNPWSAIPKPQNIVRCPPINWSQYAVVGESLDKLHEEQVQRPAQGAPAELLPDGQFEFKSGGDGEADIGKQEKYPGVGAPYAPLKDKIYKKVKGSSK